jgi:hypothetical protein
MYWPAATRSPRAEDPDGTPKTFDLAKVDPPVLNVVLQSASKQEGRSTRSLNGLVSVSGEGGILPARLAKT